MVRVGENVRMTTTAAPPSLPPVPVRAARWRRPAGPLPGRLLLALVAGLALTAAFPPYDLTWLAPVGAGLLALACLGSSLRRGALLGLTAGLALFLPLLSWSGAVAGPGAWWALAGLQSLFVALLGSALSAVGRLAGWPLWSALVWVGEEALRDRLPFGGFPWGRLAFSQGHTLLTPLAALGGAPAVTFAVAAVGGAGAAVLLVALRRAPAGTLVVPVLLAACVLALGVAVPTPTTGEQVTVAVVQGNVPRLGLDAFSQRAAVLDNHVQATHELAAAVREGTQERPDLVIWPENASDLDPFTDPRAAVAIQDAVRDVGVPVLVGAVIDGPGDKVRNTGIVWDPVTGPGQIYVKKHPVPFGEYIPYRSLVRRITSRVDLVPSDFAAGTLPSVLTVGPARLGDVICFEVAYDALVRDAVRAGGRLLVVQTNNATFGRSGETYQQLAMGQLRAVEHGRAVLVAATSGISAIIDPDGRVAERTAVFTRDVLVEHVPLRDDTTVATRVGAWPELVLSLLGAAALLVGIGVGSRRASA